MDGITVIIGVAVFIISALMIYCISAFSMREKTFEEVMEEQRRRQEEEREKAKAEKKAEKEQHKKKYAKKGKQEKGKEKVPVMIEPVEHKMVNLEIEPEIIEPTETLGLGSTLRHRGKKEKAGKSILHNRDEVAPVADKTVEARHKIVAPKDELELKKAHEKVVVEKVKASPSEAAVKEKTRYPQEIKEKNKHASEIKENLPPRKADEFAKEKPSKHADDGEKRSSKSKTTDDVPLNGTRLISSIKTAKLTDSEVQTLIEILLNRQGLTSGIPDSTESWNKKSQKGDPVLLLKKQLEEKERALQEEQSMAMSANSRVKELRQELTTERTKNSALERQFEEKMGEMKALHQRMHHSHEQHILDTNTLQTRIRQLEQGGDMAALQKLTDENKTLQEALNLKSQETIKLNENAKNLEKQLSASVAKIQSIEVTKKNTEAKATAYEEKIRQHESTQKDVDALINKRVEEVASELRKSESKNLTIMSELQNATSALTAAQGEVGTLKGKLHELEEHLHRADSNKEFERKCSDLEGNVKNLNKQLNDVSQRLTDREAENKRLQQENRSLTDENKVIKDKLQTLPASNGDMHEANGPSLSVEEHERILSARTSELSELTIHLESEKKVTSGVQIQLDTKTAEVEELKQQLSQQKAKNNNADTGKVNELQTENKKLQAQVTTSEKSIKDLKAKSDRLIQVEKEYLQLKSSQSSQVDPEKYSELQSANSRLQTEVEEYQNIVSETESKVRELEKSIDSREKTWQEKLKQAQDLSSQTAESSQRISQLESLLSEQENQMQEYRRILSQTECSLKEVENKVASQEKSWQEKLNSSQSDLSKARNEATSLKQELLNSRGSPEMTAKVDSLERELKESQEKITVLIKEKELVTVNVVELETRLSSTNAVDLEKEVKEIRSQLETERKKTKDLSLNVVKLNGIIKTGQDALSQEQDLVRKLQEQLDSKSVSSGLTETDEIDQASPNTENGTSV